MKLATVDLKGKEQICICLPTGLLPLERINRRYRKKWSTDLLALIERGELEEVSVWYGVTDLSRLEPREGLIPYREARYAPLLRKPPKIWGIGLNYREHARDLSAVAPETEPGSFMKPATTIIGCGEVIRIPRQSERTTAEAELGVVIGERCKDVKREDWLRVVAGFTTVLDMTAEDILRRNIRYLTRSKSFDTFFACGPQFLTPDEVEDVPGLRVSTIMNGREHAGNLVSNMIFPPDLLVSFHSAVMTLLPGDIISTGTPGAVPLRDGDVVECRIDGFEPLINPVRDLKLY
ncbi:MAG: fumarylacetoacetate hydrolase family protein [Candidatus Krumholzibacteriota bacterium]|nr:fumarylacetoacetate hydrolase family protein [Candidatus Krumholzibacteriota bacterium]